MNPLFTYLIEVTIASIVLGSFYLFLFRNTTFFRFNRIYLLSAMVLPLVFPWIKLPIHNDATFLNITQLLEEVTVVAKPVVDTTSNTLNILPYLYLTISSVLFIKIIISIISILQLFAKSNKHKLDNETLVYVSPKNVNPFSVFKRIVLSEKTFNSQQSLHRILLHEQAHIQQHHGIDVFIAEIICAVFWFNPMQWWLKKELKSTHEYLADEKVLEQDFDLASYFMLMLENIVGINVGLSNNFNQSLNFKRMKMMKKRRTSSFAKVLSLLAMPCIITVTIMLTSQYTDIDAQSLSAIETTAHTSTEEKTFMIVEQMPQFKGGTEALITFLKENLNYPAIAQKKGVEARVYVKFIIDKDGAVKDIGILKYEAKIKGKEIEEALHSEIKAELESLFDEATRVVGSMPNWEPGVQKGKKVRVSYRLPINFSLK